MILKKEGKLKTLEDHHQIMHRKKKVDLEN